MDDSATITLMDKKRIHRSLNRMAHEIAEKNTDDKPIILYGINERGYAIADRLGKFLDPLFEPEIKVIQLWLKTEDSKNRWKNSLPENTEDYFLIVTDDVIFSGQTMFAALKEISEVLAPSEIHTAVLIDRGHRHFPIRAEFCGMELPTKLNEHVSVVVSETNVKAVNLVKPTG
jgi:pyrimidine operon attenuation protein/uracil phosphoribosyltransferase